LTTHTAIYPITGALQTYIGHCARSLKCIDWPRRNRFLRQSSQHIDAVHLKHFLGDIQTDRGNLHVDGSPQ
jgi:hypothetical protein